MKILLGILLLPLLFLQMAFAYTSSDVEQHSSPSYCWVVFDSKIYDLSNYLPSHDMYLDIREWCGKDMTEDFITKDGTGRDHKASSYSLLERYYIADLEVEQPQETVYEQSEYTTQYSEENIGENKEVELPYNIIFPLLISVIGYWIPYLLIKKQILKNSIKSFNGFWNSILIFLLLIPAFGFGVIMILRYKFPSIWDINFDFMYWHVELSLVMGILAINHFIQRIKIYFSQLKK